MESNKPETVVRVFDTDSLSAGSLRLDMLTAAVPFDNLLSRCINVYLDEAGCREYWQQLDDRIARRTRQPAPMPERSGFQLFDPDSEELHIGELAPIALSEVTLLGKLSVKGFNAAAIQTSLELEAGTVDSGWLEAAMRQPELFCQPADAWTARRLQAFGVAYMGAMYRSLNTEAPQPGLLLGEQEQIDIILSLYNAIGSIGEKPDAPDLEYDAAQLEALLADEDQYGRAYYDPLLLASATYPNKQGVQPSCAAQMAMVAGFCEAAGWPHITGVTLIESEVNVLNCLGQVTDRIIGLFQGAGLQMTPNDDRVLRQTVDHIASQASLDRGFHGCNLVRFADGRWRQVDTTRGMLIVYNEEHSKRLDIVYDDLQTGEADGVPMVVPVYETYVLDSFKPIAQAAESATARLLDLDDILSRLEILGRTGKMTINDVIESIIIPVLVPDGGQNSVDSGLILQSFPQAIKSSVYGMTFVRRAAKSLLTKQAFMADSSFDSSQPHTASHDKKPCHNGCLRQAVKDPEANRLFAHWLRSAPLMFYQKLVNDYAKHLLNPGAYPAHPSLELSRPNMHTAMTVLSSDNAIHGNESTRLPAAWWLTYDPTRFGSLVHMDEATGTGSYGLVVNELEMLRRLPVDSLRQTTKTDRIKGFLERDAR